jgi:flagellar basal-body rod modification protein FlgD
MADSTSAVSSLNTISLQEFMNLLAKQIQFQDPSKPVDNQQFMAQMAQFAALEQQRETNQRLDVLTTVSSAPSVGLLGKQVAYTNSQGQGRIGTVQAIALNSGVATLTVQFTDGTTDIGVSLSQIEHIQSQ